MLVLSRKREEKVRIKTPSGEVIWVVLTDIDRSKARIGFFANTDIELHREELLPEAERFDSTHPKGAR